MLTIRRPHILLAIAVLLAATLLASLASRPRPAGAQTVTGDIVFVVSTVVDPDSRGFALLNAGTVDGIIGIDCSGSNPQGGTPQIPAQVMCQLRSDSISVRVFNHEGNPVTGLVRLNFTLDFGEEFVATAQATARQLHQVG